jgi:hypothetical protein
MDKTKLLKLLDFVTEIAEMKGNEWFNDLLKNRYSTNKFPDNLSSDSLEAKVSLIKNYLSIDINRVIDYSLFEEPYKESLFRDCIEMGRYEKGTPNHKIDFGEFSRHAHLQAEEMINYFLNKICNNKIDLIEEFIKEKVPLYKSSKKPTEVHHIFYTHKLSSFISITQLNKKTIEILWFLNEIRNEVSHRNSITIFNEDKDLVEFEKSGLRGVQLDFTKLNETQKKLFNRSRYITSKRKQDFNSIYIALEDMKNQINILLSNKHQTKITRSTTIGFSNPILEELKNKLNKE